MANTIRLKRASGSDPGASDLVTGALAVRTDTGKLFTKKDDNSVAEISGGISDLVDDTSPQLGGQLDTNGNNVNFLDNNLLMIGTSNDLVIYHDGSNSFISEQGTGSLQLNSNGTGIELKTDSSENMAKFINNGAVELYHDNSKKFDTIAEGVRVHGDEGGTAQLQLLADEGDDNPDYWRFVAETDGTLNIQDFATGSYLNNIRLNSGAGGVELYYNNSKKFETASGGVAITGALDCTERIDIDANNQPLRIGSSQNLQIVYTGSAAEIKNIDASTPIKIKVKDGGEDAIICNADGAVDLYHDNSLRFSTSAVGAEVHGDLQIDDNNKIKFGTGGDLEIFHDGSHSHIKDAGVGNLNIESNTCAIVNSGGSANLAVFKQGAEVELYHNGTKMFETTSSGVKLIKNCQAGVSTLTDGSTITVDFSVAPHFTVTLGGNRTFGDPSNLSLSVGSSGSIFIVQDGTGSRTASFHSDYKFVGGTAPTLSTAANAVDRIDYVIRDSSTVHCAVSLDVK